MGLAYELPEGSIDADGLLVLEVTKDGHAGAALLRREEDRIGVHLRTEKAVRPRLDESRLVYFDEGLLLREKVRRRVERGLHRSG